MSNPEINPRINPETNMDYKAEGVLSIQDCARLYKLSTVTIRKWIKKGQLSATISNNQYLIRKEDIEKLLQEKGLIYTNPRIIPETNTETNTWINTETNPKVSEINPKEPEINPIIDQTNLVNELRREIEFLQEKISSLERTIAILERDKEFLQGQVQNLTNTINILTTKQLPPPGQGLFTRLKNLFKK
jgi:excisionase family DNA binding protein